ncbi:ATP-binding protein [Actinokineospora sp. G85]|uniref:ATP-binding protein n=1 Tax=Actinokineospora sp. G85 TaxID=3406626 RepID=UPI003C72DD87
MKNTAATGAAPAFKDLLRGHRLRAGLTQEELAEGSGVSVRAISDMERGVARSPQRRTVEAMAGPLSLTADELTRLQEVSKQGRVRAERDPAEPVARVYDARAVLLPPPDIDDLTGRDGELAALVALADELAGGGRRSGHVAVLTGPPGVGKTSLAVRAAHTLAPRFPDHLLFLRLRGMSAEPSDPADVLHLVLRTLGVPAVDVPAELDQRTSLCRALLADRSALLVLDNAADEAQVRPLLVGGPRCLTLVTSRQALVGLVGVSRVGLGSLGEQEAVALLAAITGEGRVAAQRAAAVELAGLCGRLPLAIRIAGNRLASRPAWPVEHVLKQLRDRRRRLSTLTAGDLDIRTLFDLSYRQLSPDAAVLFRRLSLVPAADFGAGAARALLEAGDAELRLEELADASLLQPGAAAGRYQFHDLLSTYATERLDQEEDPGAARRADERLTDWLVRTATEAGRYFEPSERVSPPPAPTPEFADHLGAGRWLADEAGSWVAAVGKAEARGQHRAVIGLSEAMHWYSEIDGAGSTWHEVFDLAVRSSVALGSERDEAVHRGFLAWALTKLLGRPQDGEAMAERALEAATASGDLREQGWSRLYLLSSRLAGAGSPDHERVLDEVIALFTEAGYRTGLSVAHSIRGAHLLAEGKLDAAAEQLELCVGHFREVRRGGAPTPVDDSNYAYSLVRSARVLAARSATAEAVHRCGEALTLFRGLGVLMGQAEALCLTADLLRGGDDARARTALTEAAALYARLGNPLHEAAALADLAALSEQDTAKSCRERALSLTVALPQTEATAELRRRLTAELSPGGARHGVNAAQEVSP